MIVYFGRNNGVHSASSDTQNNTKQNTPHPLIWSPEPDMYAPIRLSGHLTRIVSTTDPFTVTDQDPFRAFAQFINSGHLP